MWSTVPIHGRPWWLTGFLMLALVSGGPRGVASQGTGTSKSPIKPGVSIMGRHRSDSPHPRNLRRPPEGWTRAWISAYRKQCRLRRTLRDLEGDRRRGSTRSHATARQWLRQRRTRQQQMKQIRTARTELERTQRRLLHLRRQLLRRRWRPGEIRAVEASLRRKVPACKRNPP